LIDFLTAKFPRADLFTMGDDPPRLESRAQGFSCREILPLASAAIADQ